MNMTMKMNKFKLSAVILVIIMVITLSLKSEEFSNVLHVEIVACEQDTGKYISYFNTLNVIIDDVECCDYGNLPKFTVKNDYGRVIGVVHGYPNFKYLSDVIMSYQILNHEIKLNYPVIND